MIDPSTDWVITRRTTAPSNPQAAEILAARLRIAKADAASGRKSNTREIQELWAQAIWDENANVGAIG